MMRRARDYEVKEPGTVAFLDFSNLDFGCKPQVVRAVSALTRAFWEASVERCSRQQSPAFFAPCVISGGRASRPRPPG